MTPHTIFAPILLGLAVVNACYAVKSWRADDHYWPWAAGVSVACVLSVVL